MLITKSFVGLPIGRLVEVPARASIKVGVFAMFEADVIDVCDMSRSLCGAPGLLLCPNL